MENYTEASKWYKKSFEYNNEYGRSIEGIATCYAQLKFKERSYKYLQMYISNESFSYWRWRVAGEIAHVFGDVNLFKEAESNLLAFKKAYPDTDISSDLMSIYADYDSKKALDNLKIAFNSGVGIVSLLRYPIIKNLKDFPEYKNLFADIDIEISITSLKAQSDTIIVIKSEINESITLKLSQLHYIQADRNYSLIFYSKNGEKVSKLLRVKLRNIETQLNDYNVVRVHNSFLVNMILNPELIGNSRKAYLKILNYPSEIPVSRKFYKEIK